jgi:hypothetical protein
MAALPRACIMQPMFVAVGWGSLMIAAFGLGVTWLRRSRLALHWQANAVMVLVVVLAWSRGTVFVFDCLVLGYWLSESVGLTIVPLADAQDSRDGEVRSGMLGRGGVHRLR